MSASEGGTHRAPGLVVVGCSKHVLKEKTTMGDSHFDMLMQEILRHKRIMDHLKEENRELRRQLADLREARGIYLDICGNRFIVARTSTPSSAPISYSTPASTFLEDRMVDKFAPPSIALLSQEVIGPLSAKHKQRTKEVEQMALQGQIVDSFLLE
jgi:hypothetical protein